ncbi:MAG TPA: nucleotide exchange factor GrpE [Sediminispirochaeta sp.]|nr:nucleotide exchange factor GrpE [Sediminispirochaeta sp.]
MKSTKSDADKEHQEVKNDEAKGQETKAEEKEKGKKDNKTELLEKQLEEVQTQLAKLEAENSELKNQYLRKQADFENFRKRMQREKMDAIKYANSDLLQDLVPIIDDFERAIKSSEESRDFESFHSGIKLIEHQFTNMLDRKYGLKRIESVGQEFDPQKHEAINMEESSEVETQTVVEDYQKGYFLNDRVLRHAKVKVAVPAAGESSAGPAAEESEDQGSPENAAEEQSNNDRN